MKNVIAKITGAGNPNVLVTERGVSFGYNTLVSDMRALPIMAGFGAPVVFDATHSVQQPGGQGDTSGGDRTMVPYLARAAVAAGVAAVFMEVHQDPDHAPSDGPNMVKLKDFPALLEQLVEIDAIVKRAASRYAAIQACDQCPMMPPAIDQHDQGREARSMRESRDAALLGLRAYSRRHR